MTARYHGRLLLIGPASIGRQGESGYLPMFTPVKHIADQEDAARLIACWNACAGINPEAVPELVEYVKNLFEVYQCAEPEMPQAYAEIYNLLQRLGVK